MVAAPLLDSSSGCACTAISRSCSPGPTTEASSIAVTTPIVAHASPTAHAGPGCEQSGVCGVPCVWESMGGSHRDQPHPPRTPVGSHRRAAGVGAGRPPAGLVAIGVVIAIAVGLRTLGRGPPPSTNSHWSAPCRVIRSSRTPRWTYGLIVTGPAGVTVHCSVVAPWRRLRDRRPGRAHADPRLDRRGSRRRVHHDAAARRQRRSRNLRAGLTTTPAYRARSALVGRLPRSGW